MTYALGLDFGTSFTAAAVERDGVVRVAMLGNRAGAVQAMVFVRPDGSLLHGEEAFMRGAGEPLRLVRNLKRRLGDSSAIQIGGVSFDPIDLVAAHLRWAIDRVIEREGGAPDRLVLSHPASWRSARLDVFRTAIDRAGLQPELITEPHAAAVFHAESHPLAVGDLVAAYDLGGGTFDAAVLRRTRHGFELAGDPEGEDHLGGIDFDEVVLHLVQSRLGDDWIQAQRAGGPGFEVAVAGLRRECITAKEALSTEPDVQVPVIVTGKMVPVDINRRDFEHLIGPAVDDSIGAFRRAVAGAGARVEDLAAVLLVGGSCRLPIVRSAIERTVGSGVAILDADPKHAVARGAAIIAGELDIIGSPTDTTTAMEAGDPIAVAPLAAAGAPTPLLPSAEGEDQLEPAPVPQSGAAVMRDGGRPSAPGEKPWYRRPKVWAIAVAVVLLAQIPIFLLLRDDDTTAGGNNITIDPGASGQFEDPTTSDEADPGDGSGADGGEDATADPTQVAFVAAADGMIEIPGGPYEMGLGEAVNETVGLFTVDVDPYFIDVFEVTNAQYLTFVQQLGAPAPLGWAGGSMPEDLAQHPVVGVEFVWAEAYCAALGKRLPTEAEWETAARGPDRTVFPAGDTDAGLDLDTEGSRAVGSTPANESGFGVFDTVGSVWEWVGDAYILPDPDRKVRRGGQYGRVRGGAAMRQIVDPTVQSTISETGFRCAAGQVDPAGNPGEFDNGLIVPEIVDEPSGPTIRTEESNALVDDLFEDTESGFAEVEAEGWRIGYHSPTWYHLEAAGPKTQIMSLGGYDLADADIELGVFIDKTDSQAGEFRYGVVFRSEGAIEPPPTGVAGPARPEEYYAFLINPRAGVWELIHEDELPQRIQATGPLPEVRVTDPDDPDVLEVSMSGQAVELSINGTVVDTFDTRGFHVGAGNIGLYAESFDEAFVHVHFDRLTVTPVL